MWKIIEYPANKAYERGYYDSRTTFASATDNLEYQLMAKPLGSSDIGYKAGIKFNFKTWVISWEPANPEWGEYSL